MGIVGINRPVAAITGQSKRRRVALGIWLPDMLQRLVPGVYHCRPVVAGLNLGLLQVLVKARKLGRKMRKGDKIRITSDESGSAAQGFDAQGEGALQVAFCEMRFGGRQAVVEAHVFVEVDPLAVDIGPVVLIFQLGDLVGVLENTSAVKGFNVPFVGSSP